MEIEQEVVDCVNDLVNNIVRKETQRKYREKNKEKAKEYQKQYRENNKEKRKEGQKQYKENNKEKLKLYQQSPAGRKSLRISKWKFYGIITDDYDALYYHYLNTAYCDACRVELTYDRHTTATTKVVDHDHKITDAPNFRNILCNSCNVKRRY
jgi:hypothetical protein